MATKKKAHVISDFTDAGTLETFKAGDTPDLDAGVFGNYAAAGLVRAHHDDESRARVKPAA